MGEWKEVELSAIADVQTGPFGSQLHASDYVPVGVPVIMPNNIGQRLTLNESNMSYITEADATRLARYKVQENDIVFSRRGDVDKCILIDARKAGWFCGTGCLFARLNSNAVDPTFVAYQFDGPELKNWLRTNAVGTTMPNLNSKILEGAPVALPEMPEQRAIASVLSSLDAKIDLLHRQNKTLEAMAETLFRQWFEEEAEEGWENGKVSDLCTVVDFVANGSFASLKANVRLYDEPEYALFVRTTDYTGGFTGNLKYTDKASFDFLKKSRLYGDEVIISNVGNTGTVFRPPVWLRMPMTLGSNAVALLSKDKTEFLYHYFRSEPGQGALESIVTGSAQPKFNKSNLRDLEMVIPPMDVIQRFEEAARGIRKSTMHNQVQIRTLTALRDTLLPKLMSGEVRVNE